MPRMKWLVAAIAAGWMGAVLAQGAGAGGAGAGKDTSGSAGTRTPPGTTMQEGTGSGPRDAPTPGSAEQGTAAAGDKATTLAKLHAGHDAEVQAGSWMQQHATNPKVKDFAEKMVNDHSAMDKDLQGYAQKHDVSLTGIASVEAEKAKHEEALDQLKAMQGPQADRHYMQMMVEDHTKDVREVKQAALQAKLGKDQEYAKLLGKTEKKMESHLKDAQKISREVASRQARTPTQ